jgi:flagellar motor switch protein FliG
MATLAKLKTMNDLEIQNWLKKIEKTNIITLVYALLGADEEVKNCVLRNMSSRAVNSLKADLEKYEKMNIAASTISKNSTKLDKLM